MEYLSLFEYLNHAAGSELGKKVNKASMRMGIKHKIKHVDNPKYKGKIMMYPKSFLDSYFGKTNEGWEETELPF